MYIEHAIGAFKRRCRLLRLGFQATEYVANLTIMSAALLHNFITKKECRRSVVPDRRPQNSTMKFYSNYDTKVLFSGHNTDPDGTKARIAADMFAVYSRDVIQPRAAAQIRAEAVDAMDAAAEVFDRMELEAQPPDPVLFGQDMQRHYVAMYGDEPATARRAMQTILRHDDNNSSQHGLSVLDSQGDIPVVATEQPRTPAHGTQNEDLISSDSEADDNASVSRHIPRAIRYSLRQRITLNRKYM